LTSVDSAAGGGQVCPFQLTRPVTVNTADLAAMNITKFGLCDKNKSREGCANLRKESLRCDNAPCYLQYRHLREGHCRSTAPQSMPQVSLISEFSV